MTGATRPAPAVEVRQVRRDEHAAVGALTLAAYDELGTVSPGYRQELADVAGRLGPGTQVLVALRGGAVLGSVTLVDAASPHFEHAGHGDGGFRMLAVDPAAQGAGVGGLLVDEALRHARRAGWRRVVISSMVWMPTAHALYGRRGFERRPDLDVRYGSGVALGFVLDLVEGAAAAFPPPGPVPDEPLLHVPGTPGCE